MVGVERRWFVTGLADAVMALSASMAEVIEAFILVVDMFRPVGSWELCTVIAR